MQTSFFLFLLSVCLLTACQTTPPADANGPYVIGAPDASPPKDFRWVYYDYGEPLPAEMASAQKAVWAKYEVQTAGYGCEITKQVLHDIKLHNDSLFTLLQPRYPGISEDRIMREIADFEEAGKGK